MPIWSFTYDSPIRWFICREKLFSYLTYLISPIVLSFSVICITSFHQSLSNTVPLSIKQNPYFVDSSCRSLLRLWINSCFSFKLQKFGRYYEFYILILWNCSNITAYLRKAHTAFDIYQIVNSKMDAHGIKIMVW